MMKQKHTIVLGLILTSSLFIVNCSKKPATPGAGTPAQNSDSTGGQTQNGQKVESKNTGPSVTPSAGGSATTAGTTTTPATTHEAATTKSPVAVETPAPCQLLSFEHKEGLKPKERALSTEKPNAFVITEKGVNTKTVCVRVNETPVRFKMAQDKKTKLQKVLIGPVAKLDAKVTIRFCTGKTTCKEDCSVPKDEFMEAIGGLSDELDEALAENQDTQWNKGQEDAKLQAELTSLKDTLQNGKPSLFEAWEKKQQAPACGTSKQTHLASGS